MFEAVVGNIQIEEVVQQKPKSQRKFHLFAVCGRLTVGAQALSRLRAVRVEGD